MKLNMSELEIYVNRQLTNLFGSCGNLSPYLTAALDRVEKCFKVTQDKYYKNRNGDVYFSPYHSSTTPFFPFPDKYVALKINVGKNKHKLFLN